MRFWKYLELDNLRPPELICFDHLYSEYMTMKGRIKDDEAAAFIDDLFKKVKAEDEAIGTRKSGEPRQTDSLSWNDLYYFELILADCIPVEKLRSKIVRLRSVYKGIASEKEFAEYLGAKPPDLQSPPEPADPPDGTPAYYDKLLREDLKDLLGRMYMKYAILPVREKRLTDLTLFAARLCLISLIGLLGMLLIVFIVPLWIQMSEVDGWSNKLNTFINSPSLASLTVFVVVVSGAMGGFVSALQRIQSPPTEGDSLYNLSLLFHGSKSVFVAPITGSIFAILLYLMFAAGILQGTFFPDIFTPGGTYADIAARRSRANTNTASQPATQPASDEPAPEKTPDTAPAAVANLASSPQPGTANGTPRPTGSVPANSSPPTPTPTAAVSPTPTPKKSESDKPSNEPTKGLNVFDFLARSGPRRGNDYALLMIWCFIAGFAERFVPDALDRLIANSKSGGKK